MDAEIERLRTQLHASHGDVLRVIDEAAAEVAASWSEGTVSDRTQVVEPFRDALEDRKVLPQLPDVLTDLVESIGFDLPARPVPAPPYIVVTSTGILLRSTLPPGRLVISIEPFDVVRGPSTTYRYTDQVTLTVEWA